MLSPSVNDFKKAIMRFLTLYRYYRFIGMSVIDAARHAYHLRAR
jgi:hypothetical protein